MARGSFASFLHYLHTRQRSADGDAALLARYVADRDESAFTELVRRHGPLVWHVCRQVLGHEQDAEDAFQATFLLLSRGAGSVRDGAAIAGWLHGTAWRVAHKARAVAAIRRERESHAPVREAADVVTETALRELQALLHEEVARLPAKYRAPFVLCVLEGRGRTEVARSLGWNEGTLSTRLAWARQRLRVRLARRGVDVVAALCAAELARGSAPAALVKATVAVVVGGSVPAAVSALISGGIGIVFTTKVQQLTALALLAAALTVGITGLRGIGSGDALQPPAKGNGSPAVAVPPEAALRTIVPVTVTGTATGPDDKPVKGATIYLVSTIGSPLKPISPTTTDANGRYEFRDVLLGASDSYGYSLQEPFFVTVNSTISLQVSGTAPGLAFSWRPSKSIEGRRTAKTAEALSKLEFKPDPQTIDLKFGAPKAITGRFVNEQGRPVAGAEMRIWAFDLVRSPTSGRSTFTVPDAMSKAAFAATSDRDGRVQLEGMPDDLLAGLQVTHPDYPSIGLFYSTIPPPLPNDLGHVRINPRPGPENPIWTGEVNVTLVKGYGVPVHVVSSATGEPIQNATVRLSSQGRVRHTASATTDSQGLATFRPPAGGYTLETKPPNNKDYIWVTHTEEITITTAADQPRSVRLISGCILKIEAVDVDSGSPLAYAMVSSDPPGRFGGINNDAGYSQSRQTDAQGQVRIIVAPGMRRINIERPGYDVVKEPTEPVELPAGKEVKLRFELRKKGQLPAPPAAALPPPAPQPVTVPVTITGTATGPDGQPVKEAAVYVMVVERFGLARVIATTATDAKGGYEFRDQPVPLPAEMLEGERLPVATVQVCATAPGLAFAWQEMRLLTQNVRAHLKCGKPEEFVGHIVDERGRPLPGVKVRLRSIDQFRTGDLPDSIVVTQTGSDGRFRLGGLPHGFLAQLEVSHPDFVALELDIATPHYLELMRSKALGVTVEMLEKGVWTGEINLTLVPPRSIPIQVVSDKTGEPLKDIKVGVGSGFAKKTRVASSIGTTDAAGQTVLRMPPGEYQLGIVGPGGTNYLHFPDTVTVAAAADDQPLTIRLVAGCTLEVEAVNADTGLPVPRVRFQQTSVAKPDVWEFVQDSITRLDTISTVKETDKSGKLTAVVQPGKRAIRPASPFVAAGESKPVELPAGGTVKLQILVREGVR